MLFLPPKDIKGGLTFIKNVVEAKKFKPVIDRKYPLDQIVDAFNYVGTGQKVGTVIITIGN